MGHAHVDDVMSAKIDLRRGAGAFEHNEIVLRGEGMIGFDNLGKELFNAAGMIIECCNLLLSVSEENYLCSGVCGRFEQDRIHLYLRDDSTRLSLQRLSSADLSAVRSGRGI